MALHTSASVYALEARLAQRHGLSGEVLMQRAGQALLRCLRTNWPEARRVLVLAGPGNNGGDGYVLARWLLECGISVQVLALSPPRSETAMAVVQSWRQAGGVVDPWVPGQPLPQTDLLVDGLFGIGLKRPLDGAAEALIGAINAHPAPVLAIDVPSGLDADTGAWGSVVVRADHTLCLLARKRGLYTGQARDCVGELSFDDLAAPEPGQGSDELVSACDLPTWWRPRRRSAHKGDHGHVLIVGGETGMIGAARIAGAAALRAGAGRVTVATRSSHAAVVGLDRPELMVHGVEDETALTELCQRADVIAIGPGLGRADWGQRMLAAALAHGARLVLDADALNWIATQRFSVPGGAVLTPHPAEAARLLSCTVADVEHDRFAAVRELAQRYRAVVVLKGAGTLIDDGQRCRVCAAGNPGMASAGMGDALTGIIAAAIAQHHAPFDAACAGVLAHAVAGDVAARSGGERGLLADDIIDHLRGVLNS